MESTVAGSTLLANAAVYLGAAVVMVPLASRLGLGAVLGYLIAGIVIGPWGLGLITNGEEILHFAEFGVVLLLFLIGLEMNPKRLWTMRHPILLFGSGQVAVTTIALWALAIWFGLPSTEALIVAMALSLSSTAIALQTLTERNLMKTRAGCSAFSILLFQDISVIPMLALIPMLVGTADVATGADSSWVGTLRVVGLIGGIVLVGHYLNRPILRFIAKTGMREVFTAFALLLVIGISLLMQAMEISMALGSFLAGVLLADSEYRHELELEIEPFKGLLLGLFFIAVGMTIDFSILLAQPLLVVMLVLLLIGVKGGILWTLSGQGKEPLPDSQRPLFAVVLSQGGEFAFVLFTLATSSGALNSDTADLLVLVVALSMMSTPLLMLLQERWIAPRYLEADDPREVDTIDSTEHPVIIAGFGRFGRVVGRLLHANGIPTTILDHDPERIEHVRKFGYKVYYGDATRASTLRAAGARQASLLVISLDDPQATLEALEVAKKEFPHLRVLARCDDMTHGFELLKQGVDVFQREVLESALVLGEEALKSLGFGAYRAKQAAHTFREHDRRLFDALYATDVIEKRIFISQQARDELQQVLKADEDEIERRGEGGWE